MSKEKNIHFHFLDDSEFAYMQYISVCPGEKDEGDYDDASIDGDNDGDIVQLVYRREQRWCIGGRGH